MSIFMVPEHPISCDSTNLVYNSHSRVAVWWEWPLCVTDIPESFLDHDYVNCPLEPSCQEFLTFQLSCRSHILTGALSFFVAIQAVQFLLWWLFIRGFDLALVSWARFRTHRSNDPLYCTWNMLYLSFVGFLLCFFFFCCCKGNTFIWCISIAVVITPWFHWIVHGRPLIWSLGNVSFILRTLFFISSSSFCNNICLLRSQNE